MAYADPNYDPKAAHEYYIKHRKLKGRKKRRKQEESSAGRIGKLSPETGNNRNTQNYELTDSAKAAIERRDRISIAGLNDAGKAAARNVKANLQAERSEKAALLAENAKAKIADLREKLKGMSKEERAANKERIAQQIEAIREDVRQKKEQLKKEYDDKYVAELSTIKMNSSFQNERSIAGMTEDGKARAKELKQGLMQRRRDEQAQIAEEVKEKIASLRKMFKINRGMSDEMKEQIKLKLRLEVDSLREYAKQRKAKIKEKYDGEYQSQLNKLKQDKNLMRGVQ